MPRQSSKPVMSVLEEEVLYLSVAKLYKESPKISGIATHISKKLKVNGVAVGKVIKWVKQGVIKFREGNEPFFTISYPEIKRIEQIEKEALDSLAAATKQADKTYVRLTAAEADEAVKQYIIIGRAVWQAIQFWATKHNITPQQLRKMPLEDLIPEALDKMDQYEGLMNENKQLKATVGFYQVRLDPDIRFEKALNMIVNALLLDEFYREMGFDFLDSRIGQTYAGGIDKFLTGVQIEQ